jgi:hypothetical protein
LSAGKTVAATTLEFSVGSFSEANLPVSIKPVESRGNLVDPLDEIPKNLDLEDTSDLSRQSGRSEENYDCISNYSEEDFTDLYNGVSHDSEDEWTSGLELHDDDPTIFSSERNYDINTSHQVCAIIKETLEDLNSAQPEISKEAPSMQQKEKMKKPSLPEKNFG